MTLPISYTDPIVMIDPIFLYKIKFVPKRSKTRNSENGNFVDKQ